MLVECVSVNLFLFGLFSMAKVGNTSRYTVDHVICTNFESGFGLGSRFVEPVDLGVDRHRGRSAGCLHEAAQGRVRHLEQP